MSIERFEVNEDTSARYTATLKDETGAVVPGSTLTTLTLTLYNVDTKAIINNRDAQNVLGTNGVTVDNNGILVWTIAPSDNPVLNATKEFEIHRAVFQGTWGSGKKVTHAFEIVVANANMRS